jgi:hypothetical protein
MSNLEKLTKVIQSVGYQPTGEPGQMNVIALLGSIGEAGETLEEYLKQFHSTAVEGIYAYRKMKQFVGYCREADELKKAIRDKKISNLHPPVHEYNLFVPRKLDQEIADELYYLLAKMLNRGENIEYFATLCLDKLQGRIAQNIQHGIRNLEMPKEHQ